MNMKRLCIIATALAFLVALTQCKKQEQAESASNEGESVAITLDVKGNGNSRIDVNTATGEVAYQSGDVVYVVSNGKFIGTLTHDGTNFTGIITEPTEGEPLYFYFLGNVTPTETLTQGVSESCSVIISDQTNGLPVIECAPSNEIYASGITTFTAMLLNKCALVKFNVATASTYATIMTGFNNKVTVDFTDATFTYSMEGEGNITLSAGRGEKWAILLPQDALEVGELGSAYSVDGAYIGVRGAIPPINENGYLTTEIPVTVTVETNPGEVPMGAIDGKFTISSGVRVYFSQGNLQYQASTDTWRFAETQTDIVGASNSNISPTYDGWIDLFGWGTGNNPTQTSTNNSGDYSSFHDWGVNAISNGGNMENSGWHTLNANEWKYLFNTRHTASDIRYAKAVVDGMNGVILLPDNWLETIYMLNNTNSSTSNYNGNLINAADWANILEANGAVFLPAAGYRQQGSINNVGSNGYYWSKSGYGNASGWCVWFSSSSLNPYSDSNIRSRGHSVRLVHNEE